MHSSDILPWGQGVAENATRRLLAATARLTAKPPFLMNLVENGRPYALICYDLFLQECDEQVRSEVLLKTQQPIHLIIKRGNAFRFFRSKELDAPVAAFYENMIDTDKDPRPYFIDELHTPVYVDGKRIESPNYGSPDPEEPESCD
jgi:hypothetical protein